MLAAFHMSYATGIYSLLPVSGQNCAAFGASEITSVTDCQAAASSPEIGLTGVPVIPSAFISPGCNYYSAQGTLIFFTTSDASDPPLTSFTKICIGAIMTTTLTSLTVTSTTSVTTATKTLTLTKTLTSTSATSTSTITLPAYVMLPFLYDCADVEINEVTTKEECFNGAIENFGLTNPFTVEVPGLGLPYCSYGNYSGMNLVFFNPIQADAVEKEKFRKICQGIPRYPTMTPTTTSLTSITQTITLPTLTATSTSTATTMTMGGYTLLDSSDMKCEDFFLTNINSARECFDFARVGVNKPNTPTIQMSLFFSGCAWRSVENIVYFSNFTGSRDFHATTWRFICRGVITSTTTTNTSSTFV